MKKRERQQSWELRRSSVTPNSHAFSLKFKFTRVWNKDVSGVHPAQSGNSGNSTLEILCIVARARFHRAYHQLICTRVESRVHAPRNHTQTESRSREPEINALRPDYVSRALNCTRKRASRAHWTFDFEISRSNVLRTVRNRSMAHRPIVGSISSDSRVFFHR